MRPEPGRDPRPGPARYAGGPGGRHGLSARPGHPQDRAAFEQVLAEGKQGGKTRREPRVLRIPGTTGQSRNYAVRFISLTEETGLLCARDVTGQTQREQRQNACTSVEDVARLLRSRICADADFTEIFDIATGRRIRSGADLDPMTLSEVETLEEFFRRLEADIHPADRPQLIACAAGVLALDPGTAAFWDARHVWRVRMGERDGEPVWRWHEATFLYKGCSEKQTRALEVIGHNWVHDESKDQSVSCTVDGFEYWYCSNKDCKAFEHRPLRKHE